LNSGKDYVTIKYDFYGNEEWVATYNGTGNGDDVAKSIKYVGGNVYVTGTSTGSGTSNDIVTIAYSSSGRQLWVARYDDGSNDNGNDIAVDSRKGVYVTGVIGNNKFATIKYDNSTGSQIWTNNSENGEGNSIGIFRRPCSGDAPCYNIETFATGKDGSYAKTIGYDENGNILSGWPVTNYSSSSFVSLGIDGNENIFVTGSSGSNYLTVKYSSNGTQIWAYFYHHNSGLEHNSRAIKVDGYGNAFVTGTVYFSVYPTPAYYTTIKYVP
jgi:hypothetical protein